MTQQPSISIDVSQRSERPLRYWLKSPWPPLIVVTVWLELTGLIFGPATLAQAGDWTWIYCWYAGIYSIVPAQFCVLHLALIFAPEPFRQRFMAYWLTCLVTLAGWYGWLWTVSPGSQITGITPGKFTEMAFWLPPFLLALQLPLRIVRWVTGWRLVNQ